MENSGIPPFIPLFSLGFSYGKFTHHVSVQRQVDYVNTHGTSTPIGDVQELGAVKRVFEAFWDVRDRKSIGKP